MLSVLRTKLFIPPQPDAVLDRPQLLQKLNQGRNRKLTLVTAPPGYGKTTLITLWLRQQETRETQPHLLWLSLDERDDNLLRFFTYFTTALSELDESFTTIGDNYLQDGSDSLATESLVIELINRLAYLESSVIFVIDDYHEIKSNDIHKALSFWLDHQPPQFHLVLTSRSEPPLQLPRLRVRRQVTEIDDSHLRFTMVETADFLNRHMQLALSANDIAQLDSLTEGWVASLQLAALSLQNQSEPAAFIETFKGTNRDIVDYLAHEVLERQPPEIRDFLLQTSILERLNGDLCQAVTGNPASRQLLETLDQSRLFVIPLDHGRQWYRYHHLFAGYLRETLAQAAANEIPGYHERASLWFENNGFLSEAIAHAFAAPNTQLAAKLIGRHGRSILTRQGELTLLRQWISLLPHSELDHSPQLLIIKAWLQLDLYFDQPTEIDTLLDRAAALINPANTQNAPIPPEQRGDLETEIALARANQERLRGNLDTAIQLSEQALKTAESATNPLLKIGARGSLASVYFLAGRISQFLEFGTVLLQGLDQQDKIPYARYIFIAHLIDAWRLNGQLATAAQLMHRIAPPYERQRKSIGAAILTISWAGILHEQNELDQALEFILPAIEQLRPLRAMAAFVQNGAITLAKIYTAQGHPQRALTILHETSQNHPLREATYPSARLEAIEALIHLHQRNLVAAQTWAKQRGLEATDTPTYLYEIDYLVFAHVLVATNNYLSAQQILSQLALNAQADGRVARQIEITLLQTLVQQGLGRREEALTHLHEALDMAFKGGFKRVVVDTGRDLLPLMQQIAGRGHFVNYIQTLLPLFGEAGSSAVLDPKPLAYQEAPPLLLNPLTDRELATLRYLATNLTIPEIAEQMIVAPSTIRTYVKRIYSKLDVHNRIEAVNRARTLSLL